MYAMSPTMKDLLTTLRSTAPIRACFPPQDDPVLRHPDAADCGNVPHGALEVLCLVRCMWQPGRRNMQSTRGLQNMTPGPIRSASALCLGSA